MMSIEQTMKDSHRGVRERLGMGVKQRQPIPLRIMPPAAPKPLPKDLVTARTPINASAPWRTIVEEVAEKHGVTMRDFLGDSRSRKFVSARKEAAWRLVNERGMSYPDVARRFGYKDHTSILNLVDGHAKIIGAPPRRTKQAADRARKARNQDIVHRLNAGAFVAELSRDYRISTTAIREIARNKGFDFSVGADARAVKSMASRRLAAKQAKAEKEAAERLEKQEMAAKAMKREKAVMVSLCDQYYSYAEAGRAVGVSTSTIRNRAIKHGVIFRNTAIAMPMKGANK